MFVDVVNNRVGIGSTAPTADLEVSIAGGQADIDAISWSTSAAAGGALSLSHSNHATQLNYAAVDAADVLGQILFKGSDSNSLEIGAAIKATAAETFVDGAEFGSYLSFHTVDIGTAVLDERMRIFDAGEVAIGYTGEGRVYIRPEALNDTSISFHAYHDAGGWKHYGASHVAKIASAATGLSFSVAGTAADAAAITWIDAMTIGSTGKIGIGTTAPATFLHVNAAGAGLRLEEDTDNDYIQLDMVQGGRARLGTSDARVLTIQEDGGNVGIGHSGADEMLHLQSATTLKPVLQLENATDDATSAELKFVNGQGGGAAGVAGHDTGRITFTGNMSNGSALKYAEVYSEIVDPHATTGKDGKIGFKLNCLDTDTEVMTIKASGNDASGLVGIGTTNPKCGLQVGAYGGLISNIATQTNLTGNVYYESDWKHINTGVANMIEMTGGSLTVFTAVSAAADATATWLNRFKVFAGGNVAIGAVTPVSFTPCLEIRGTNPALCLSVDATHFYNTVVDSGNNRTSIMYDDSTDLVWYTAVNSGGTSPTERMKLTSAGVLTVNGAGVGISDWTVTSTNLLPDSGSSQDIGSTGAKVANVHTVNLYLGDANLDNTDRTLGNEVDGTKGSWTIQEGDENLFVLNRISGKKYKMSLIEA
ncbi:MAG: hypothetical protein CL489_05195 [Acidobacteria bacterium]|nr:hypothetical protein [Acidobacteriota bacterium]